MNQIAHSCCPQKMNIEPPYFKQVSTIHLSKHEMEEWKCEGCQTRIMIITDKKE